MSLDSSSANSQSLHVASISHNNVHEQSSSVKEVYTPFNDEMDEANTKSLDDAEYLPLDVGQATENLPVYQDQPVSEELPAYEELSFISSSVYDDMTLKELQNAARTRGIQVERGAKKQSLIELLKSHDSSSNEVKPGSLSSSSILESYHEE
jgi:hypothetical protein